MTTATTTAWGHAIDRVLADGQWHHRDEILDAAVAAVPPGVAYRKAETRRQAGRTTGDPAVRTRGDRGGSVASGAREIARQALRTRVRKGTVLRSGDQFRRRP